MSVTLFTFIPEVDVPVPPVVVAGDVSSTINLATPPVADSILPTVTADGVPTMSYTLTIVSGAAHGTAAVSGTSLEYTPAAGFAGVDTFTYKATVSGVDSNVATVTVNVLAPPLGKNIQKQHRLLADLYADTTLDCYCRTDSGPMDLTGYQLTAHVHPYNRPQPYGQDYGVGWPGIYVPYHTEFPAEQVAIGHVQFTVDHGTIRQRLGSGMWRVNVVAVNPNTEARTRVYTALLTIQ